MKQVLLKVTSVELNVNGQMVKNIIPSTQFIKDAMNTPAPNSGGFDVSEMQKRLRILNEVEKVAKEHFDFSDADLKKEGGLDEILKREAVLELEDADMKNLHEIFSSAKFGIICSEIPELAERIANTQK